jgi:hypothetical protein
LPGGRNKRRLWASTATGVPVVRRLRRSSGLWVSFWQHFSHFTNPPLFPESIRQIQVARKAKKDRWLAYFRFLKT